MAPYFGSIEYMRAQKWDQFIAAMNRWGSPSENQVYADIDGNIGWKPGGRAPIRPNWDGMLPVPGDGSYEWTGFYDMDQLPQEYNPKRGWVATANQMNLPTGYPYRERKPGFEWASPWRYQRINEILSIAKNVTLQDSLRLQTDYLSVPARRITAVLKGLHAKDSKVEKALEMMRAWNCVLSVNSAPAVLFEIWYRKHLCPALATKLVHTLVSTNEAKAAGLSVGTGDPIVIFNLIENTDSRLGANPVTVRDEVLLSSLSKAIQELEKLSGPEMEKWAWGKLHHAKFEHPLSKILNKSDLLDVGPLPRGGSGDTVGNTSYRTNRCNPKKIKIVFSEGNILKLLFHFYLGPPTQILSF